MRFLKKLTQYDDNLYTICKLLFKILKVNVTNYSLKETISNHTYFPSLLTITDTLNIFGVNSAAIKLGDNKLEDFQTPFLIPIQKKGWDKLYITIINNISSTELEYYDPFNLKWNIEKKEVFEKWMNGTIILVEKNKINGEKDFLSKKKIENNKRTVKILPLIVLLFLVLLSVVTSIYFDFTTIYGYIFISLFITGFIISLLLIFYEIDIQNPFLKKVCSGIQNVNCGAVLKTKGASFYGLEWSVIGLSYFFSGCFTLLIFGFSNFYILDILSSLSIISSFYIIYSLYYQFKIAKQWCILCLGIQAILFLQMIISFHYFYIHISLFNSINFQLIIKVLLIYSILLTTSIYIFPIIKKYKLTNKYKLRWKRLKTNPNVFKSIMSQQKKVKDSKNIGIILGNPDAKNEIIKVCNPYCMPCADAHPILEKILNKNNDIRLKIIFTASNDINDITAKPVKHFMALADNRLTDMHTILDDWYVSKEINKDYNIFSQKYPLTNEEIDTQGYKLTEMSKWCDQVEISSTPTFYINGYALMEEIYTINDLSDIFAN